MRIVYLTHYANAVKSFSKIVDGELPAFKAWRTSTPQLHSLTIFSTGAAVVYL